MPPEPGALVQPEVQAVGSFADLATKDTIFETHLLYDPLL